MTKNILQLNHHELKVFLLEDDSYCNADLPPYFTFNPLLSKLSKKMGASKNYHDFKQNNPSHSDNLNYKIISNKNGKYDWRPIELINPILYASLVGELSNEKNWQLIKERFDEFYSESKDFIQCMSLPIVSNTKQSDKAEQIKYWWENMEQKSIELSLEYDYMYHTDISNCYSSIYTHSISWAIHTKETAKEKSFRIDTKKIGNAIDNHLQAMSYGQTNGIPQGSIAMDFIAEIILHYADSLLSRELKTQDISDFNILRYRDDYRIFCNNTQTAHLILKKLTDVLSDLGLKMHANKTNHSDNVILGAIKQDKLDWLFINKNARSIQKKLLILHQFTITHPNSGTIISELYEFHKLLEKAPLQKRIKKTENITVLISIIVDIAFISPKVYPISMAVISVLLRFLDDNDRAKIVDKINKKFSKIPNIGFIQIWLQRAIINYDNIQLDSDEKLTQLVKGDTVTLWNTNWAVDKLQKIVSENPIIDRNIIDSLDAQIRSDEVSLFTYK